MWKKEALALRFISELSGRVWLSLLPYIHSGTAESTGDLGSLCLRLSHYIRPDVPEHHGMNQSISKIWRAHLVPVVSLSLGKQWFRSYFCCIGGWKTSTEAVRWSHYYHSSRSLFMLAVGISRSQFDDQISLPHKLWNISYVNISTGMKS